MTVSIKNVTLQEAEGHLDELLALVVQGEEVIITKGDQPCAKLIAVSLPSKSPRAFGLHAGTAWMSEDFHAPLPDNFWLGSGA